MNDKYYSMWKELESIIKDLSNEYSLISTDKIIEIIENLEFKHGN